MKQIIQKYRLWLLCLMGAMMLLPDRAWGIVEIPSFTRDEIGYTIEVKGGNYYDNDDVTIVYRMDKGLEYYDQYTGELLSKDGIYTTTVKVSKFNEGLRSISPSISKSIKDNETLIAGLNYAAQLFKRTDNIEVAKLQDDVCVISETIGCYNISNINIEGNVSIRSEGGKEISLFSVLFDVKNGGYLNIKDLEIDEIAVAGGTVNLENACIDDFTMTNGELFAKRVMFRYTLLMSGGMSTITEGGPSGVAGNFSIEGGTMNFSGNVSQLNLPEESTGVLNITGGSNILGVDAKGGTLNISDGIIYRLNVGGTAEVSLSGGKYMSINISDPIVPENVLASGFGYYTWDRKFRPDLPFSASLLKENKISYFVDGVQVKNKTNAGIYTNEIFEAAKKANVGPNGRDVRVIRNDDYSYSTVYRYEINSEVGLCWMAIALSGYVRISGDNDYNGIEYLTVEGGRYNEISPYSDIVLTKDLDISSYDWIPLDLNVTFDGQGHRINGVKVKQAYAAFFHTCRDVYNLIVSGTFEYIEDGYLWDGGAVAGLAVSCDGRMINCGVEQSSINLYDGKASRDYYIGGLIASYATSVQNCYVNADINVRLIVDEHTLPNPIDPRGGYIGGLVGYSSNTNYVGNCYFKGSVNSSCPEGVKIVRDNDFIGGNYGKVDCGTCYTGDEVSETTLNENVAAHNAALLEGEIEWKEWKAGSNGPVYKNSFSVIEFPFTLKAEGPGTFEGYYLTGEEEEQEKHDFQADTTIIFTNARTFHVTPKPGKGATLVDVVKVVKKLEEGVEKLDSIPQAEIKANEEYKFLAQGSIELVARFRLDTLYIENDTTVLGGSDEITSVDRVEISASGSEENKPAVVEIGNVTVQSKEDGGDGETPEGKTTITEDANVILKLSGTNDLGTLTNNGCVTIEKGDNAAEVSLAAKVINTGTLIDNTGLITEVLGEDEIPLLSVLKEEEADKNITSGEIASLSAKATVPADATVTFQWQRGSAGTWTDIGESTTCPERTPVVMRAMKLDAEPEAVSYTNNYSEALNAPGTYEYRCLIKREVIGEKPVSTTLSVYGTVTVEPKTEPEPDPTPDPVPDPTPTVDSYTITLPSVVGATTDPVAGDYTVEEGSSFSFTLTLDSEYSQSAPVVKAGNETLQSDADGRYTLADVSCDLTISITGITPDHPTSNVNVDMPVRVWSHKGVLRLYSETKVVARIITFDGHLHKTLTVLGHVTETDLPKGVYLVLIKKEVFKLMN